MLKLALGNSSVIKNNIRKKALLALLRIYRRFRLNNEIEIQFNEKSWIKPLKVMLEKYASDHSVINSVLTFIDGIINITYDKKWDALSAPVLNVIYNIKVN